MRITIIAAGSQSMAKIIKFRDSSEQLGSGRPDVEELELQLRFHRIAMRQSKIAFWRWSFEEEKLTHWSDNYTDVDLVLPEDVVDDEVMLEVIHPDDRQRVVEIYDKADKEETSFDVDYRIVNADGEYRWIHEHAEVDLDEAGKAIGFFGVLQDISKRKELELKLETMAHYDDLTGLFNRREFGRQFAQSLERVKRNQGRLALFYIDLDGFKQINDTRGHNVGDRALQVVATRIRNELRTTDIAARVGGDEFNLLFEGFEDDGVETIAERILQLLAEPIGLENRQKVSLSASIGIAIAPDLGTEPEQLTTLADDAMYRAKGLGKNRYALAGEE